MSRRIAAVAAAVLLACSLSAARAADRQDIRIPDIPGFHTLKCDFHMHTVFSDGNVWPTWRVEEAWRDGLDALAITDHIEYLPKKDDVKPSLNRPYELAAGAARERGLILVRGAEITKDVPPGHFNALFLKDVEPLSTNDLAAQLEAARAQDAFVFWNHPGWRVKPGADIVLPLHEDVVSKGLVGGAEIFNGSTPYTNAWNWMAQKNLTLLGNSDTHAPVDPPQPRHENHRTMTLVFAKERTADGLKEALRAGRTAVWWGTLLAGRREVLEPLVAACVTVEKPHHRDSKSAWVRVRNGSDLSFELTRTSGPGPASMDLPAGRTVLLKLGVAAGKDVPVLEYACDNVLTGPGEPLPVKWTIAK